MEIMQRIHQVSALIFMALSVFFVWESWELEYHTPTGPGAGFFPFWLGAVMGGMSLIWLVQVSMKTGKPVEQNFLPGLKGRVQIISMIAALVLTALLMNLLGFQLSMFLFFIFMLMFIGKQSIWISLVISIIGSVGVYHLFVKFLDVQLPLSSLSLLNQLGL
jgi:putative tricarboxylic transport membrane protein